MISLAELDIHGETEETGNTYEENATIKAIAAMEAAGMPAIADDSGLEVEALEGAPGIKSSRFAGEDATDEENNRLLLKMMEGVPESERGARFVCTAVLVRPAVSTGIDKVAFRAEWHGFIASTVRGKAGFGYDPLFVIPDENATVAELGDKYKQRNSHRAKAFQALARHLETL